MDPNKASAAEKKKNSPLDEELFKLISELLKDDTREQLKNAALLTLGICFASEWLETNKKL